MRHPTRPSRMKRALVTTSAAIAATFAVAAARADELQFDLRVHATGGRAHDDEGCATLVGRRHTRTVRPCGPGGAGCRWAPAPS